jgi:hypothetical protein
MRSRLKDFSTGWSEGNPVKMIINECSPHSLNDSQHCLTPSVPQYLKHLDLSLVGAYYPY